MEHPQNAATVIELKNFEKEFQYLTFLVDPKNENIHKEQELSVQAGEIVGKLYDSLLKAYGDKDPVTLRSLNVLCVRIVFCLYAEDAGLFPKHLQFFDYLKDFPAGLMRDALLKLFKILDTPEEKRSKYESQSLLDFPYVNGGLFASQDIDIPQFTEEIKDILLQEASSEFDWSAISPTIFGAVFESTLNPETRRKGGMHYTSITNIHKVIDPLFLDDLREEFEEARKSKSLTTRNKKLLALQDKMASLTFLDPACGSGNFLTETFTSLRTLENDIIRIVKQGQGSFEFANPIKISISQFYGIEINDFAVSVAKTALWIAESQMMIKTQDIVQKQLDFLPLKSNANIHEGNALRLDWNEVIPASNLNFIMGNPPFIGAKLMTPTQKEELLDVLLSNPQARNLDYVAAWFGKSRTFMEGTAIQASLVATNSICQGEQATILWKQLLASGIHINFAYTTFRWDSEALDKAHVHCVIIGFSFVESNNKKLFTNGELFIGRNINPYLTLAPTFFIEKRNQPLSEVPPLILGNMTYDDGNLILSEEEKNFLINKYPESKRWIKPFYGAFEFLNGRKRFAIWLENVEPSEYKNIQPIRERVSRVKKFRESAKREGTRRGAMYPSLFLNITQRNVGYENFILLPIVSSERREYVPMGFMGKDDRISHAAFFLPDASLYHLGVLMSSVHMAWMRAVAGRLEMRYRYSNFMVYNNFVWPEVSEAKKKKIEDCAQKILDSRELYKNSSLADLYDPDLMPIEVREAHQANDRAVMQAYGFKSTMTEPEIVAELFKLYEARVKELEKEEAEVKQKTKVVKRRKQVSQK